MAQGKQASAITLPFTTGDYLCTWSLPDRNGGFTDAHGALTVERGKWPSGQIYGEMPVDWAFVGEHGKVADYPQSHEFDSLVGHTSSGAFFAFIQGGVTYWLPSRGRAVGSGVVLSREPFVAGADPRRYASIRLQIEGLDSIAHVAPIKSCQVPTGEAEGETWAATLNSDAGWDWKRDGVAMSFGYSGSFRTLDPYEFRLEFSPFVTISADAPLTILEWWAKWVVPLQRLVSLSTGARREVTYLLASTGPDPHESRWDQVFGWTITQEPTNSTSESVRGVASAISLARDELSLLDLVVRWQSLVDVQHPIIETYGGMVTSREQHPRSQFLLLIQALEGLHGFENRIQERKRQDEYSVKRGEFVARMKGSLESEDYQFLKKHLKKYPDQGLETALVAVLGSLPVDVRPELENTRLASETRAAGEKIRVESLLARARNQLSHGSRSFEPRALKEASEILDRVVRSETLRLLGAPPGARERALMKPGS